MKYLKLDAGDVVSQGATKRFRKLTGWQQITSQAGLYDENDVLVASWDVLTNTYKMDVSTNYTEDTFTTHTASPYYVLTNFPDLYSGVKLILDSKLTSIGNYAFSNCDALTSIMIPDSVRSIGSHAFEGCESLVDINIPYKITSISDYALCDCVNLTNVNIPNEVTTIGAYAFDNCISLRNIIVPDSVTDIGYGAFQNCSRLTRITLSNSITSICDRLFYQCAALTDITIPDNVANIGSYAFYGCGGLSSIVIPDNVTTICEWAFWDCYGLLSIVIPHGMTTIDMAAFHDCANLSDVYYFGTEEQWSSIGIGDHNDALRNATIHYAHDREAGLYDSNDLLVVSWDDLTNRFGMNIDKDYETIDAILSDESSLYNVLTNNSELSSGIELVIPDGITRIGQRALYNCDMITNINIPDSVISIGADAFDGCSNLAFATYDNGLYLGNEINKYRWFIEPTNMTITICDINKNTKFIADNAFADITTLTGLVIPDSIITIPPTAFFNCAGIAEIVMPSSIANVYDGAFCNCDNIADVYYMGTEQEWNRINIHHEVYGNEPLMKAMIHYNCTNEPIPGNHLVFRAPTRFTLGVVNNTKYWNGTLEYSTNGETWKVWSGDTPIDSSIIGLLYLRGIGNTVITGGDNSAGRWVLTGKNIACIGNIETLLDYKTVATNSHPAMSTGCYRSMFSSCSSLITAPELPATELTDDCYQNMFWGCNNLTVGPKLPATTLATSCYYQMFANCSGLTTAPELPATILADYCYYQMFANCSRLINPPELPATILADYCYYQMFANCTNLNRVPELPATTLVDSCYRQMFENCDSILGAPKLPVVTLAENACDRMFYDCAMISGELDLTNAIVIDGIGSISSTYAPTLIFGPNLETIVSNSVFFNNAENSASISIRYEFTDDDVPKFNTTYVVSKGIADSSDSDNCGGHTSIASYRIYTDNTAIKDGALSNVDDYTMVSVYHLNGEAWQ